MILWHPQKSETKTPNQFINFSGFGHIHPYPEAETSGTLRCMSYELHSNHPRGWGIVSQRTPYYDTYEVTLYRPIQNGAHEVVTKIEEEGMTTTEVSGGSPMPCLSFPGHTWRLLVDILRPTPEVPKDVSVLEFQLAKEQQRIDDVLAALLPKAPEA